nr:hypothetical protein [Actinomycetota bacterium]
MGPGRDGEDDGIARSPAAYLKAVGDRSGGVLAAAGLAFLVMLLAGAVSLVAIKLSFPNLGSNLTPFSVVTAMAVLGLASLGTPLSFGSVDVSVLPLGTLLGIGLGFAWAANQQARKRQGAFPGALAEGAAAGLAFGLLCFATALLFRLCSEGEGLHAHAGEALLYGCAWGVAFGVAGAARAHLPLRAHIVGLGASLERRSRVAFEGVGAGSLMLAASGALAIAALLVRAIAALAVGSLPQSFGWRDAAASLLFSLAFLPNVVVTIIALSLGAGVEIGGRVTVGGRTLGNLAEYSLFDWNGQGARWYLFLLLLIPILSCGLGGYAAYRNAHDKN